MFHIVVLIIIDENKRIQVKLKLVKKMGPLKIEIPCIDGFGSCTYEDICKLLPPDNNGCSEFFKENSIPCSCPFPRGDYSAQNLQVDISLPAKPPGGLFLLIVFYKIFIKKDCIVKIKMFFFYR